MLPAKSGFYVGRDFYYVTRMNDATLTRLLVVVNRLHRAHGLPPPSERLQSANERCEKITTLIDELRPLMLDAHRDGSSYGLFLGDLAQKEIESAQIHVLLICAAVEPKFAPQAELAIARCRSAQTAKRTSRPAWLQTLLSK